MKTYLALLFLLLIPLGCTDRKSDQRLVDLAVSLEKNSGRIEELSTLLEGISNRLAKIEEALAASHATRQEAQDSASLSLANPSGSAEGNANLDVISRQVASLAGELAAMKEEMTLTRTALEEVATRPSEQKDAGDILHKLAGKPEEFAKRLDEFLLSAALKIEDPAARQNFEAEVRQLRDRVSAGLPFDQLYQEFRGRLVEKLSSAREEGDRRQLEKEVAKIDNSSEEELRERLTDYNRWRTAEEFFRIAKTYSVPKEDIIGFLGYGDKKGKR